MIFACGVRFMRLRSPEVRGCASLSARAAGSMAFGRHAPKRFSCLGHVAQGCDEYLGVRVFGSRRKIFRDDRVVIEIRRRVEWLVNCFLFFHSNFALLSALEILRRRQDCNALPRVQSQQIGVSRKNKAGLAVQSYFEKLVILGIAAFADRIHNRHELS